MVATDTSAPADFKAMIRQRGWQMADAAARWAIQPQTLSRVAADPEREIRWDDLVRSLPALTRRERAAATAARLQLYPPPSRRRKMKNGPQVDRSAALTCRLRLESAVDAACNPRVATYSVT